MLCWILSTFNGKFRHLCKHWTEKSTLHAISFGVCFISIQVMFISSIDAKILNTVQCSCQPTVWNVSKETVSLYSDFLMEKIAAQMSLPDFKLNAIQWEMPTYSYRSRFICSIVNKRRTPNEHVNWMPATNDVSLPSASRNIHTLHSMAFRF